MSNRLCLHCGASQIQRDALSSIATPEPTDTWFPIPHTALIEQVETALGSVNMRVVEQAHSITREGLRYFGLLMVANCQKTSGDYAYVLGLRNAHDRSFKAGLTIGHQVFVCDNLAFSGEITIARKHTRFIMQDLPTLTVNAVGRLAERWTTMNDRIARYKQYELSDGQANDLIIRAFDAGAITLQQIPDVIAQWRKPNHPEFAESRTAWRLFNAATEAAKGTSLQLLPRRTIALHGLMDAEVGLLGSTRALTEGAVEAGAAEIAVADAA